MIRAGVVGASGYLGGELIRLLLGHPNVELAVAASRSLAGRRVDSAHPNLRGLTDLTFRAPDDSPAADHPMSGLAGCDVVFVAVPHTAGMRTVPPLLEQIKCVIDLGADFRLHDPDSYARYYGQPHVAPELPASFVPGIPELHRAALAGADRISVPGCMALAATLALRPLTGSGLVDGDVLVDGRIGSSGSGAGAERYNLHAERSGAMRVFAPAGHRHEAEIRQHTGLTARMSATGVEAVRGLQVLCRVPLRQPVKESVVRRLYREAYQDEPFVRVVAQRRGLYRLPEPKILIGSNFCDVGFAVEPYAPAVVAIAALDNLVKGGAGNAVQCLNIRMGWPERLGLEFPGLHPI